MIYPGSSPDIIEWLLPLMKPYLDKASTYYEPFVGGGNTICKVPHPVRIGSDSNKYLIALLRQVQEDVTVIPATISEEMYQNVRQYASVYEPWLVGLVAFCASYEGIFWGKYTGEKSTFELLDNLRKQAPLLKGVKFMCLDYTRINFSKMHGTTLFFCDFPCYDKGFFGFEPFFEWCKLAVHSGHMVLYLGNWAPSFFVELGSVQQGGELRFLYAYKN